jgi:hypothetical protein
MDFFVNLLLLWNRAWNLLSVKRKIRKREASKLPEHLPTGFSRLGRKRQKYVDNLKYLSYEIKKHHNNL